MMLTSRKQLSKEYVKRLFEVNLKQEILGVYDVDREMLDFLWEVYDNYESREETLARRLQQEMEGYESGEIFI